MIQQFETLETFTVYTMMISGCCVLISDLGLKVGVPGQFAVRIQHPCKIDKCLKVWPLQLHYEFTPFIDLQQRNFDEYCDVFGRLVAKATRRASLPILILTLMADGLTQDVECLGNHASTAANVGDAVAIKDAVIRKYNGVKCVQTALLSVIEINPHHCESLPALRSLSDLEQKLPPKKRRTEFEPPLTIDYRSQVTIDHANQMRNKMVADLKAGKKVAPKRLVLRCKIRPFDDIFFTDNPPFVGAPDAERVRWRTEVFDMTGVMRVVIWDPAAISLLEVSPGQLRKIWEDGQTNEKHRVDLLKALNAKLVNYFLVGCTAKSWKDTVDVNVNSAIQVVCEHSERMRT